MWMQLISLNKVIFEDHIFTFKYATNGNDLFSIITSSLGNKFFDNTHLRGRPFWCQNNENVAQVLDNNRIKPSQNTFLPLFFPSTWPLRQWQPVRVWEPSFIYNFNTNNNAQILRDDIAKKWNQLQIKEKNKKKKNR